jgi:hypothetical protein
MNLQASCLLTVALLAGALTGMARAQKFEPNYDESKVPKYTLPDPLVTEKGEKITTAKVWKSKRRPEILQIFQETMYGNAPEKPKDLHFEVTSVDKKALGGKAVRKEVTVYFTKDKNRPKMHILIYLPANATKPVPLFVGLNFNGNHTIHKDPGITLGTVWVPQQGKMGLGPAKASDESRGKDASRWQVEEILKRGYGIATIYYGDIEPDFIGGFKYGIRSFLQEMESLKVGDDGWGSIGAWAWALSRAMDYFETDQDIDSSRIIVMGHSRLGKTALWAGAQDQRFAITISNNSGCGGAALSRRRFGETIWRINTSFPHWFCTNFRKYSDNENKRPVDQHELIALIAPRPVYVASAEDDKWADPKGEFLSLVHAEPVYKLLGTDGLGGVKTMPAANQPIMHTEGYHLRAGKHDVTAFDWYCYLDFADRHLKKAK